MSVSPPKRASGLAAGILTIMLTAGAVVYWQGRTVLVARINEQIANEANHKGSLLEQAVAEAVASVESLAAQPIMGRILDDDEDHEIAELLAVANQQSNAITELTCFASDGKTIASTNLSRLGTTAESSIKQLPNGPRYVISWESGEARIIVPISRQFDELKQIGQLMAVVDRRALLNDLDAWWAGLISNSGKVLVSGGQRQLEHLPIGTDHFTDPDFGTVQITRVPVKMPERGVTSPWVLAVASPHANRYRSVEILGWMITVTTLFSSGLVLGVVHYFSRKQRGLVLELSDQCLQLERATMEIEGQKEQTEAANIKLSNANDSLEEARVAATVATRAKSDFLANMSHEIRTPMTAILGFAEILQDSSITESERLDCARTIHRNGKSLLGIINDILDLSKVEAGKMRMNCVACEPCSVIADIASLVRVQSEAKGLSFNIQYKGTIPKTIQTDPVRLRQILINLIGNAIKFTEAGSVCLLTCLVDDGDEPCLQFDVIDTGQGMTAEQAGKLFQPFMQANTSATRQIGGTGLGLTISKRFAEMLGGGVMVAKTEHGVGSTFRATVATGSLDGVTMLEDPLSATVLAEEANPIAEDLGSKLQGIRILLAEDNPTIQILVVGILKKAGAEITAVGDGKLALNAALAAREDGRQFDMILMDIQMPNMGGYEATELLRQKCYRGPIIALTAHAMEGDREKCLMAGCDACATKPIERKKLIGLIAQHVQDYQSKLNVVEGISGT